MADTRTWQQKEDNLLVYLMIACGTISSSGHNWVESPGKSYRKCRSCNIRDIYEVSLIEGDIHAER